MVFVVRPRGPYKFVPPAWKDDPEKPFVMIRDLTDGEHADIMDAASPTVTGEGSVPMGTLVRKATKYGMVGWSGIYEKNEHGGKEAIEFKSDPSGQASDESLVLLPWEVKKQIGMHILNRAQPDEEDKGKPAPSPED